MNWKEHYKKIQDGDIPDDYTNYFYSHFGFYEDNSSKDSEKFRRDMYEKSIKPLAVLREKNA